MGYDFWHVYLVNYFNLFMLVWHRETGCGKKRLYIRGQHNQTQSIKSSWVPLKTCVLCFVKAVYAHIYAA